MKKSSLVGDAGERSSTESMPFSERIREYLAGAIGTDDLVVHRAERLLGGLSRESWRIDAQWRTADGVSTEKSMVFRLDSPSSLESNRRIEYAMYKAFWPVQGVPVPKALFIENETGPLGMTFFVMDRLDGVAQPGELRQPMYREAWPKIASQMFEILGVIARQDYRDLGLADEVAAPNLDDAWAIQLDHWEKFIRDHDIGLLPVTAAAIRHLRRNPPPPIQKVSVVHGDYRIGNYLFTTEGITGILDWELAHLGDPLEDLAWSFARTWYFQSAPGKIAGKFTPDEAIRIWEDASGLKVNRDAFKWWELFTNVRANAIWIAAVYRAAQGSERRLLNWDIGWKNLNAQELWMLEDMGVGS